MYNNNTYEGQKIYSKTFNLNQEERPVVASFAEQCPKQEVDWGLKAQEIWNVKVAESIASIAQVNPYLPDLPVGEEILGVDAASWVPNFRSVDCRPKLFDNNSKSWKM